MAVSYTLLLGECTIFTHVWALSLFLWKNQWCLSKTQCPDDQILPLRFRCYVMRYSHGSLVPIWCANLTGHSGCPKRVGYRALTHHACVLIWVRVDAFKADPKARVNNSCKRRPRLLRFSPPAQPSPCFRYCQAPGGYCKELLADLWASAVLILLPLAVNQQPEEPFIM